MSDSSSSSDESDDSLLASPVFKKRDRRTERAEKNKLDFLDTCLKGSDARTDVHRRIAEVDNELLSEDEDDGSDGEGGELDGKDGRESGSSPALKASNGSNAIQNNDGSEKEASTSKNNDAPAKPDSANATKVKPEPGTSTKTNNAEQREQSYWERVESFAQTNLAIQQKTPGTAMIHTARRDLADAVAGLEDYASDLTDDEGGKWKDGVAGMTREQMRSEAEAKSQGAYSRLGCRRMFLRRGSSAGVNKEGKEGKNGGVGRKMGQMTLDTKNKSMGVRYGFSTRQEALQELKTIMTSLQKSYRVPKSNSEKQLRKLFIDPLVKITKQRQDIVWDTLHAFLRMNPVLTRGRHAVTIPASFCEWMWRLACSPYDAVGRVCSRDCCLLLRKFLIKEFDIGSNGKENPTAFGADLAFLKKFCMDDLVDCLENEFGLWMENGPMPDNDDYMEGDDAMEVCQEGSSSVDVYALKNVMLIWKTLLDRNLIQMRQTEEVGDNASVGADATRVLVAFTRLGLDPHFTADNEGEDSCGEPTLTLLQGAMSSLINSATQQISQKYDDEVQVEQWMERTATAMVEACSNLGPGDEDTADMDDAGGDIPLAMAVKRFCSCEFEGNYSADVALMKSKFAQRAVQRCLNEIEDWDKRIKERTEFLCKDWKKNEGSGDTSMTNPIDSANREQLEHAMSSLITAEVGFAWIDNEDESEAFVENHPHFLAAVLIAGECASIGTGIYWRARNDNDTTSSEEPKDSQSEDQTPNTAGYSTAEKDAVYEVVSNIEDLCDGLRKECRAVIAHPHLRRTKEYLTRLVKELCGTKGKSSKDKRQRRKEQGSLDSYFGRPSLMSQSDPFRETQDS